MAGPDDWYGLKDRDALIRRAKTDDKDIAHLLADWRDKLEAVQTKDPVIHQIIDEIEGVLVRSLGGFWRSIVDNVRNNRSSSEMTFEEMMKYPYDERYREYRRSQGDIFA